MDRLNVEYFAKKSDHSTYLFNFGKPLCKKCLILVNKSQLFVIIHLKSTKKCSKIMLPVYPSSWRHYINSETFGTIFISSAITKPSFSSISIKAESSCMPKE